MTKLPFAGLTLAALLATGLGATATAQDATGYQVDRHTMMEQVGQATRILAGMARGEAPYEAGAALNGMRVYLAVATAWPHMFPEGTETGNDTRAAAAIWDDPAGFVAAADKFAADAAAGIETAGTGLEAFQAAFGTVAQNCRSCHEVYRTPDQ
jgi:cytochrome c556